MATHTVSRSAVDSTLGHVLRRDLTDTEGYLVAAQGSLVTEEMLALAHRVYLEEELLCAVLGIPLLSQPPQLQHFP